MSNEISCRYRRYQNSGDLETDSECKITLSEKNLMIIFSEGLSYKLDYTQLENLNLNHRQVSFTTPDGKKIELYYLTDFSIVSEKIRKARNDGIIGNLLIPNIKLKETFNCYFRLYKDDGSILLENSGELKLYNSFLFMAPQLADPFVLLYNDIKSKTIDKESDLISLKLYTGQRLELLNLIERVEELASLMEELINNLVAATKKRLVKVLPDVSSEAAQQLANLVKSGRAVEKAEMDSIDATLWGSLEGLVAECDDYQRTYNFLKSQSIQEGKTRFGIKGNNGTSIVWYQVPLGPKSGLYIAVEDVSLSKHNTFIFRVKDHSESNLGKTMELISRTLVLLDFKFEVLYLPEKEIMEGNQQSFKVLLRNFDFIRDLRDLYFFRVRFHEVKKWERDLKIILGLEEEGSEG